MTVMTFRVLTVVEGPHMRVPNIICVVPLNRCYTAPRGAACIIIFILEGTSTQRDNNSTTAIIVHRRIYTIVLLFRVLRDVRNPSGQWLITVKCLGRLNYMVYRCRYLYNTYIYIYI